VQNDLNNWVLVLKPEDLPKGVRKEVKVEGVSVLLFWYRNQIYAIEARSPAEGAYSEGFIAAKFTQDYGIECPGTKSVFSLKNGEILEWYPNNPVLRLLTPQDTCRPLDIYPVKLTQDAIMVDVSGAATTRSYATTRGGADTSIDRNNVYALQPKAYIQGQDPTDPLSPADNTQSGDAVASAATLTVAIVGVGGAAVAGTAFALYKESLIGLVVFWIILFGASTLFVIQYKNGQRRLEEGQRR
jgi:nitrite reductase/ring-hydroxylating ferredoxin subunit